MGVLFSFSMSGEQNAYLWRQLIVVYIPYSVLLLYSLGEKLSICGFHSAQPSPHRIREADPLISYILTSSMSVLKKFTVRTISCKNIFYNKIFFRLSYKYRKSIHFYALYILFFLISITFTNINETCF